MNNPILSWCLAVRNAAERLPIVMKAIRERTPDAEVVVVDNCSGDNTVEVARQLGADIVHEWRGPKGDWTKEQKWTSDMDAARNLAMSLANGRYVGWIDDDDRLPGPEEAERIGRLNAIWLYGPLAKRKNIQVAAAPDAPMPTLEQALAHFFEHDKADAVWCPYIYARDASDKAKVLQPRERFVRNPKFCDPDRAFKWILGEHEILVPINGDLDQKRVFLSGLIFLHEKKFTAEDFQFSTDRHWAGLMAKREDGERGLGPGLTAHEYNYLLGMCVDKAPDMFTQLATEAKRLASSVVELYRIRLMEGQFYAFKGYMMESMDALASARNLMPDLPDAFLKSGDIEALYNENWGLAADYFSSGLSRQLHMLFSEVPARDFEIQYKMRLACCLGRSAHLYAEHDHYDQALACYERALTVSKEAQANEAIGHEKPEADLFVEYFQRRVRALKALKAKREWYAYVKETGGWDLEDFPEDIRLEQAPTGEVISGLIDIDRQVPPHTSIQLAELPLRSGVEEIVFRCERATVKGERTGPFRVRTLRINHKYDGSTANVELERQTEKLGQPVAFTTFASHEEWNASTVYNTGIGASEESLIYVMRALAQKRDVDFYGQIPFEIDYDCEVNEYVRYWPRHLRLRSPTTTPMVVSRSFSLADQLPDRKLVAWLQDVGYPDLTPERVAKFAKIVCVSNWHKDWAVSQGIPEEKIAVIPNFLLRQHFDVMNLPKREPHHMIYASSPDRGLRQLLLLWPHILAKWPDATLDIFYGWNNMKRMQFMSSGWTTTYRSARRAVDEAIQKYPMIRDRGRVNHVELSVELHRAAAWPYVTTFTETSCATAMKARAAGVVPVCTPVAALVESAASKWTQFIDPTLDDEKLIGRVLEGLEAAFAVTEAERAEMKAEALRKDTLECRMPLWEAVLAEVSGG